MINPENTTASRLRNKAIFDSTFSEQRKDCLCFDDTRSTIDKFWLVDVTTWICELRNYTDGLGKEYEVYERFSVHPMEILPLDKELALEIRRVYIKTGRIFVISRHGGLAEVEGDKGIISVAQHQKHLDALREIN